MMILEQRAQDRWFQAFLNHLKAKKLFESGDRVLLCCSGGLDSTVLTHFFSRAADLLDIDVEAIHVDHKTRSEASAQEGTWVQVLCDRLGVPLHRMSLVATLKKQGQAEMRDARRAIIEDLAQEKNFNKLVTAHHSDDNAETLMMRLMSGSGINGLKGMPPIHGKWIKPLLPFSKEDLRDYAAHCRLGWVEDPSNARSDYLRNQIRNEIFPRLEEIRRSSIKNIARLAERVEEEEGEWTAWVENELRLQSQGKISLGWLEKWPLVLQRRILRSFLSAQGYENVPAWVELLLKKQDLLTPTGSFVFRSDTLIFSAEQEFASAWASGLGPLEMDRRYDLGASRAWSFLPYNSNKEDSLNLSVAIQFRPPTFQASGVARLGWEALPWPLSLRMTQKNDPIEWIESQLRQANIPKVFWRSWPLLVGHENQDFIGVFGIAYVDKFLHQGLKRCVCVLPFFEQNLRPTSQSC